MRKCRKCGVEFKPRTFNNWYCTEGCAEAAQRLARNERIRLAKQKYPLVKPSQSAIVESVSYDFWDLLDRVVAQAKTYQEIEDASGFGAHTVSRWYSRERAPKIENELRFKQWAEEWLLEKPLTPAQIAISRQVNEALKGKTA